MALLTPHAAAEQAAPTSSTVRTELDGWLQRSWVGATVLWRYTLFRAVALVALFGSLAFVYAGALFPLDATKLGAPGDFEAVSAAQWFVANTVAKYRELPLWNPYVYSGVPFIGDPYYPVNPLLLAIYVPLGAVNGAKVAAVAAIALAGVGQYWLSRVLGHTRAVSLAAGLVGLSSGFLVSQITTGFSPIQAQQQAWLAATLASFLIALRSKRPGAIALAALCYTMCYLAGHFLYWEVLSVVLVIFTAGYAVKASAGPRGWALRFDSGVVARAAAVAGLTFLLIAMQILPTLDLRSRVTKPMDIGFNGTQPPLVTLFNLVMPDHRFWVRGVLGAMGPELHYSYLGAGLFLFLLFVVPAFRRRPNRDLPLLAVSFVLALSWASARHTFMFEVWQRWDGMRLISFQAMVAAVVTVLFIPLALAGADYLWRCTAEMRDALDAWGPRLTWRTPATDHTGEASQTWRLGLLRPVLWALLALVLWNVAVDPWHANRRLWRTVPYNLGHLEELYARLKVLDSTAYTIQGVDIALSVGVASIAQFRHEVQVLAIPWRLQLIRPMTPGQPNEGWFTPAPKYLITRNDAPAPPGATLVEQTEGGRIYQAPPGLPFAFVADPQRLPYGGPEAGAAAVTEGRVTAATARFDGPNRIVVEVPPGAPPSATTLVVMQGSVPGWSAGTTSGERPRVQMAGGYLAITGAKPGETYVLSYLPLPFLVGVWLTLVGLAVLAALVWMECGGQPLWRLWGRFTSRLAALRRAGPASGAYGPVDGPVRPAISSGDTR
jgi:hypothetical protein